VRHFPQHCYIVTINSHNGQLTLCAALRLITCLSQWRSTAEGKDSIVRQIRTTVQ
jgi:hypothetical protein